MKAAATRAWLLVALLSLAGGAAEAQSPPGSGGVSAQTPAELAARVAACRVRQDEEADLSVGGSHYRSHPELNASSCIRLGENKGLFGRGFVNDCDYPVQFSFCAYRPRKDAWSEAFDCEKSRGGTELIQPKQEIAAHTANAEYIYWAGCRFPEGSPADFRFTPMQGYQFRCNAWASDKGRSALARHTGSSCDTAQVLRTARTAPPAPAPAPGAERAPTLPLAREPAARAGDVPRVDIVQACAAELQELRARTQEYGDVWAREWKRESTSQFTERTRAMLEGNVQNLVNNIVRQAEGMPKTCTGTRSTIDRGRQLLAAYPQRIASIGTTIAQQPAWKQIDRARLGQDLANEKVYACVTRKVHEVLTAACGAGG